jgi:hypothetical protein
VQLTPIPWRRATTFDQQVPSANSPCTKTTFFVFGGVWATGIRSVTLAVAREVDSEASIKNGGFGNNQSQLGYARVNGLRGGIPNIEA